MQLPYADYLIFLRSLFSFISRSIKEKTVRKKRASLISSKGASHIEI